MKLRRFGACILAVSMLCSLPVYAEEIGETESAVNMEAYKQTGVEGFVYRLYKLVLNPGKGNVQRMGLQRFCEFR